MTENPTQKGSSQRDLDEVEWENTANWHYGLFYHSERDSRAWVPKRSMFGRRRFGGTPNFAQKSARQTMMMIVGFCVLFVLVVAIAENMINKKPWRSRPLQGGMVDVIGPPSVKEQAVRPGRAGAP